MQKDTAACNQIEFPCSTREGGKKAEQNMALFAQRHCYSIQQTDGIKIYGDLRSFFD